MLRRSLTSCLIKPLANDFVPVINSICSLKRSVHTEGNALLEAAQGLPGCMVIEVYGVFPCTNADICELEGDGRCEGRWAASPCLNS